MEALFRIVITFLTKYCPQKPAKADTPIKYKAEKKKNERLKKGFCRRKQGVITETYHRGQGTCRANRIPLQIRMKRTSLQMLLLRQRPVYLKSRFKIFRQNIIFWRQICLEMLMCFVLKDPGHNQFACKIGSLTLILSGLALNGHLRVKVKQIKLHIQIYFCHFLE